MHIICTAFSHGQVTCQLPNHPPSHACQCASQVSMAPRRWGERVESRAGAKQKSNVMFMSCYLILRVLLYSARCCCFCSLYFISPFVCLFFLSFFFIFLCVLRLFFCFYLFGNISLTLTFRTPLINSKTSWRSLLQLPLPFPPLPCVLAPTRRFMTFTFMTGICASVCVRVCLFCCCMQAWKAAEILICYFIAYTQRVLRCMIYGPAASTQAWSMTF